MTSRLVVKLCCCCTVMGADTVSLPRFDVTTPVKFLPLLEVRRPFSISKPRFLDRDLDDLGGFTVDDVNSLLGVDKFEADARAGRGVNGSEVNKLEVSCLSLLGKLMQ